MSPTIDASSDDATTPRKDLENGIGGDGSGSEDDIDQTPDASNSQTPGAGSSKKSKKKKKKTKTSVFGTGSGNAPLNAEDIPQELVDVVVAKVREEHGEGTPGTDEESVRQALAHMGIKDVVKGKAGVGGTEEKGLVEHRVCPSVQP